MASDKTQKVGETTRKAKLGENVHVIFNENGIRSCVAGRVEDTYEYSRGQFPEGELGDKMLEQHLTFHAVKVSYMDKCNVIKTVNPCTHMPTAQNGYHLPEECPYGL